MSLRRGVQVELAEVLTGRAGLFAMQELLAGRRVRARLRRDTGALLSDAALGPLRLQRAKFKPGRYLRASYQAALSPNNGGTIKARPIEVTWNADGMEVCHPLQPDLLDLQAEAIRSGLAAPFERLAARLPSVDACIQISPLDAAFPQLMRLSDPQFVQELLREVLDRRPGPDTNKLPFHHSVTPIRYRPGQRHVLRYDFAFGDGRSSEQGTIFAKLYQHAARGTRIFQLTSQVSDWLEARQEGIGSLRPLAYFAEQAVILYPQVTGRQLSRALFASDRWIPKYLSLAGSILRALHQAPAKLAEDLEVNTLSDEARVILRASEHIQVLLPDTGAKIRAILERGQALYERIPQESPVFTHSDFKADHLWITPASLMLIDFDTCSRTDPAIDVGKFLADLQWWYSLYEKPGLQQAQNCFLNSYTPGVPQERLLRARLYEVLILTKTIIRRVPIFDRHWASRTSSWIDRAESLLCALEAQWAK